MSMLSIYVFQHIHLYLKNMTTLTPFTNIGGGNKTLDNYAKVSSYINKN